MAKRKSKMQNVMVKSGVAKGKPPKRPSKPITGTSATELSVNGTPVPNVYRGDK